VRTPTTSRHQPSSPEMRRGASASALYVGAFVVEWVVVIGGTSNLIEMRRAIKPFPRPGRIGSPHWQVRLYAQALYFVNPTASGLRCRIAGRCDSGGSSRCNQWSRRSGVVADAPRTPAGGWWWPATCTPSWVGSAQGCARWIAPTGWPRFYNLGCSEALRGFGSPLIDLVGPTPYVDHQGGHR
jgi:hypothetical protein